MSEQPLKVRHTAPAADEAEVEIVGGVGQRDVERLTVEAGDPLPPVAADAEHLGRALDNLLMNAVNYTDPGGSITLAARHVGPGRVELSVADTGVGLTLASAGGATLATGAGAGANASGEAGRWKT